MKKLEVVKFTFNEVGFLITQGYERVTNNEYRKILHDGDYETITKDDTDEFSYYFDVADYKSDIDRMNGCLTKNDLTWEELTELYF